MSMIRNSRHAFVERRSSARLTTFMTAELGGGIVYCIVVYTVYRSRKYTAYKFTRGSCWRFPFMNPDSWKHFSFSHTHVQVHWRLTMLLNCHFGLRACTFTVLIPHTYSGRYKLFYIWCFIKPIVEIGLKNISTINNGGMDYVHGVKHALNVFLFKER